MYNSQGTHVRYEKEKLKYAKCFRKIKYIECNQYYKKIALSKDFQIH